MGDFDEGVASTRLQSWAQFHEFVTDGEFNKPHWIFRGQRSAAWLLESTLTRELKKRGGNTEAETIVNKHREQFRYAIRGRRGPYPADIEESNLLWALGQHHGLATPLLDWTTSPYVALFFVYAENRPETENEDRMVFALNPSLFKYFSEKEGRDHIIEVVNPLSDENPRLLNQAGVFTTLPYTQDLETWIREHFRKKCELVLARVALPNADRAECLRALNRMNINYATLFPDLTGASRHCNLAVEIPNYATTEFDMGHAAVS